MRRSIVLGGAVLAVAACTLTTSLDGLSGPPLDTTPDASGDGSVDAPSGVDGSDAEAGVDAGLGPNLYETGDFEGTHAAECTGTGYKSNLSIGPARSGTNGCVVCAAQGSDIYTIDRFFDVVPKVGEHYRVTAWVKKYGNIPAPAEGVLLQLRSARDDPFQIVEFTDAPPTFIDDTWKLTSVDLTLTKPAPALEYYVGAKYQQNICFVVDDIQLFRISN